MLSFDLGAPVGDVAWAPFSSTVFAAATDAGRVHVFDLGANRGAAACVQRVARKSRLTKLAFNARHPVLLVGTEHGGVTCLKLSPNLRRSFNQGARLPGGGPGRDAALPVLLLLPLQATDATPPLCPPPAAAAVEVGDGRLARTESHRLAVRSAEAARLDAVLEVAAKCNAAVREEDWALL